MIYKITIFFAKIVGFICLIFCVKIYVQEKRNKLKDDFVSSQNHGNIEANEEKNLQSNSRLSSLSLTNIFYAPVHIVSSAKQILTLETTETSVTLPKNSPIYLAIKINASQETIAQCTTEPMTQISSQSQLLRFKLKKDLTKLRVFEFANFYLQKFPQKLNVNYFLTTTELQSCAIEPILNFKSAWELNEIHFSSSLLPNSTIGKPLFYGLFKPKEGYFVPRAKLLGMICVQCKNIVRNDISKESWVFTEAPQSSYVFSKQGELAALQFRQPKFKKKEIQYKEARMNSFEKIQKKNKSRAEEKHSSVVTILPGWP